MKELSFYIHDVREATDNRDVNGVKDKEIIRYFNDAVKSVQAIIFKNNPLCSYFQKSADISRPTSGKTVDLPTDVFADNAVSFVEIQSEASLNQWSPLERCWPEDQNSFLGWFTRNKTITFTGRQDISISYAARVWYFQRLGRWDKAWATVTSKAGQILTLNVLDADMFFVDSYLTVLKADGTLRVAGIRFTKSSATTITVVGDISSVVATDQILLGKSAGLTIELPEEVEPYLLDYVAKRVYSRNNYSTDASKIEYFTQDDKDNIAAIFADIGQAQVRAPITDTDYLRV